MRALFETLFDIVYLVTVITLGIRMIRGSKGNRQFQLFGWMAVVLGAGDSFHLVPRALALCTTGFDAYAVQLGLGKWITSITMTIFYVLLYYVWRERYQVKNHAGTTVAIFALAVMRVALCMLPQNQWLTNQTRLHGVSCATSRLPSWALWSSCCFTAVPGKITTKPSAGCGSPLC